MRRLKSRMSSRDVRVALARAYLGRYPIRIHAVTATGTNTGMEGHVTAVRKDGEIRFRTGEPDSGLVYDLPTEAVIGVERVRGGC